MIKSDKSGPSGWGSLNDNDRVIARRAPGSSASPNAFANSGFGNSGFGNSGFGNGGLGSSSYGPSGIVPSHGPGLPPSMLGLLQAIQAASSVDTVKLILGVAQWQVLAAYLQPFTMEEGQALIEQGSKDTTVYLVEAGTLNVLQTDEMGHAQVAMVGPGSCIGEGAFFSRMPRNATVQAATRCKLWSITPMRYTELSNRHPPVALALVVALGSVLARRMNNKPKRGAVT